MDNSDKIDDYLLDRMSAVEKTAFERDMVVDAQLRESVELRREIIGGLQALEERQVILDSIDEVYEEEGQKANSKKKPDPQREAKVVRFPNSRSLAIAAVLLLLIVVALYLLAIPKPDYQQLADSHFEVADGELFEAFLAAPGAGRAVDAERDSLIEVGMEHLRQQQFSEAKVVLEKVGEQAEGFTDLFVTYYLGQIAYQHGQYAEAQGYLESIDGSGGSPIQNELDFYLALIYLRQQKLETARERLQKVLPKSDKYAAAQDLLKYL